MMKRKSLMPARVAYRPLDIGLLIIAALLFIGTLIYLIRIYPTLPAEIPSHYNLKGDVDGWSSPRMLWFLLATYAACFIPIAVLGHFPRLFNLPSWADAGTMVPLARWSRLVLEVCNIYSGLLFFWMIVVSGQSKSPGIGFFVFLIGGSIVIILLSLLGYRRIRRS